MANYLRQSTAVEIGLGPFVDNVDGFTPETGLTILQADVRLKKNDGDWAQKNETTALVHEENGWYRCLLNTTDTATLGVLLVAVNETGALPVWREFHVVPANVYDSMFSTDLLQVDVTQWLGVAPDALSSGKVPADLKLWLAAAPAALTASGYIQAMLLRWLTDNAAGTPGALIGGRVDSNLGALGGVVQSATDLKDFADDGYDPATNKVQGVVLVDTTTTVTGGATAAAVANVQTDTDNIQARLPAALTAAGNLKADVEEWLAGIIPAPNVTGVPKVDLVDIDGAATNGNNATLKLKQLNIYNNSATAVEIISEVAEAVYIESEAGKGVFVLGTTGGIVGQGTNSPGIAGRSLGAFPDAGIFAEGLQGLFVIGTDDGILATGGTGKSISALQDIAVSDGSLTLTAIANKVWATVLEGAHTAGDIMRLVLSAASGLSTKIGNVFTFRNMADTKDRIKMTTDGAGSRTTITTRDGTL